MRLHLIRHPKPAVASDICYGRTDVAVAPQDLTHSASSLIAALPRGIPVFSSPLLRCAGLAGLLADALGCAPVRFDARLMEMDFGDWEMRKWDDIGRSEVDAWVDDMAHYRPGGGESLLHMAERVRAFHEDLMRMQLDDAIVVCHAGSIRMLLACQSGFGPVEMALHAAQTRHTIAYGEVIILDL